MVTAQAISENRLVTLFRTLPEQKQVEVMDFILFIISQLTKHEKQAEQSEQPSEEQEKIAKAVAAVEKSWGSIPLDLETARYVAEDKELEYDV